MSEKRALIAVWARFLIFNMLVDAGGVKYVQSSVIQRDGESISAGQVMRP